MSVAIRRLADAEGWEAALCAVGARDVYYERAYVRALQDRGEGEALLLDYEGEAGRAAHVLLERPLPAKLAHAAGSAEGVDWISPYGYAGPLLRPVDETDESRQNLAARFAEAAADAAHERGAVSEFVRFHPILPTHAEFEDVYHIRALWETVVMNLSAGTVENGLSGTCAKNLKTARKKGVTVAFEGPEAWERFVRLYRATMDRRDAAEYYVFDDAYFRAMADGFGENCWFVFARLGDADAAGAMILRSGDRAHYHLGGSDPATRSACPTNALLVEIGNKAQGLGLSHFHLGGGLSRDDGLFRFKAGFAPGRATFRIGGRVFDRERYDELTAAHRRGGDIDDGFFPAYRAPRVERKL
ncbi:MAG: GNAT family N-acetyltransferase [Deltaproteobacteria bacterium]|nr:GNAT family N-acetyltransferase [Deltaproteobacteria bacterium]